MMENALLPNPNSAPSISSTPAQPSAPTQGVITPNLSAPEPQKPKKSRVKHLLYVLLLLIIGAAIAFLSDFYFITDTIAGFSYQPSSEMASIAEHISLTGKGERILKASHAELQNADNFNSNCPSDAAETSVLGCYYDWRIYIYNIDNKELDGIKEAVLSHELLHAVWQREKSWTKDDLTPLLRKTYEKYKAVLEEHMKTYSDDYFVDELHSIIGTQIEPSALPLKLRDHYAQIFKDQAKIVAYYNQYNDKFVSLRKELAEMGAKIEQMKKDIEVKTESYRKKTETLSKDIDTFNRNAANGFYSGSSGQFEYDRAQLISRQDALNKEYQELTNLVNETNKLVEEYNSNVARSSDLYGSINSNIKKMDSIEK